MAGTGSQGVGEDCCTCRELRSQVAAKNTDKEKQTTESGWGLQDTKGISEAPVVLGTYRRLASKNQEDPGFDTVE